MHIYKENYKNEIKKISMLIKENKKEIMRLKLLTRTARANKQDFSEVEKEFFSKIGHGKTLSEEARYFYLAYAQIRQMDLTRLEKNPRMAHNPYYLEKFIQRKEEGFRAEKTAV